MQKKASRSEGEQVPDLEGDYFVTEFIPYMLNHITNTMNQRFKKSLKKYKLNVSQWRVLVALGARSGASFIDLGEFTAIDQPSLSRIVEQLVERDLVTRAPRPGDARYSEIALTPAGRELRDTAWPLALEHGGKTVEALSAAEQDVLRGLLKRIMVSLG